jgi:RNA polymerase sigma factor (sigma-70 family)
MMEPELEILPGARLFQLCADHLDGDEYWAEFVRRYNPVLARAVYHAYQRFAHAEPLSQTAIADTLQEIYLRLLKDDCQTLRRFAGQTEAEAQSFLAQTAIHIVADQLRRARALKRPQKVIRLDDLLQDSDEQQRGRARPGHTPSVIAEYELTELLHRTFTSEHGRRDILLFLLHFVEGVSARELAESGICDLKPSSISTVLHRMREELRKILAD